MYSLCLLHVLCSYLFFQCAHDCLCTSTCICDLVWEVKLDEVFLLCVAADRRPGGGGGRGYYRRGPPRRPRQQQAQDSQGEDKSEGNEGETGNSITGELPQSGHLK